MAATNGHLQRLSSNGVSFHSFTEEHLSTDSELVRNILLANRASLAKLEREKISQQTKPGRPRTSACDGQGVRAAEMRRWRPGEASCRARWRPKLACREHYDADSLQHCEEARPCARVRTTAPSYNVDRASKKPAWLRADPSGFTSPRFTFLKSRVPLRARSISKFGTLGPIRASGLFEAPAICWHRWVPRCLLLPSRVVRRCCTGRVTAFDGSPCPSLPPGTPLLASAGAR